MTSAREFANSWTVSDCEIPLEDEIPCSDDATRTKAEELCNILNDENGEFEMGIVCSVFPK